MKGGQEWHWIIQNLVNAIPNSVKLELEIPDVSLLDIVSASDTGIDLVKELQGQYISDPVFKEILNKPKDFRNFELDNNIIYLKEFEKRLLCIPNILIKGRSVHEIIISEVHSILAHLGANKTLDYLRDHVWWKSIVANTKAFCETCVICK